MREKVLVGVMCFVIKNILEITSMFCILFCGERFVGFVVD